MQSKNSVSTSYADAQTEAVRLVAWNHWLYRHPECDHAPFLHDALQNPDGCGHCRECHYAQDPAAIPAPDSPRCGHSAGCPGC